VRGEPGPKGDWFCMGGASQGVAEGKRARDGKVGDWESVGGQRQLDQVGFFEVQVSLGVEWEIQHGVL